ncbi:MAG TPA: PAS domain-containing sensor histidine kinase [Gemmatimonadaceae bacterium]
MPLRSQLPADFGAAIVSIAADAIISVDENQRIVLFNKGAEQIFGYTEEEILGQPLDLLIPPRAVGVHRQHIRDFAGSEVMARRMGERREISAVRKNGEEFPADASILKTRVDDGWLFTVVLRDITVAKRATEEQGRLLEAAKRAARMRDEVLGVVSHDLRNPLSVVRMCVSTLLDDPPPPTATARELVREMANSVDWMERLIQDLLDVASIEAGRLRLDRRVLDAIASFDEAASLARSLADRSGLEVKATRPQQLPTVLADRDRVLQVFANLVGNAVKFTPRGGSITLSAATADHYVLFSVSDTGPGIDEFERDRLFDRYWQAQQLGRRGGAGLGLAISQGIVDAHGGEIRVESRPGEGSTFTFTLPVAPPGEPSV